MTTLKKTKNGFQDCRLIKVKSIAKLSTFIKLPFVIKLYVLPILAWPFYTDFTVLDEKNGENLNEKGWSIL